MKSFEAESDLLTNCCSSKSLYFQIQRQLGYFVGVALLTFAGAASADPTVELDILNAANSNGDILVTGGQDVEVGFNVTLDSGNALNKKDIIQLVRFVDGTVLTSKIRGAAETGSISLTVPKDEVEQLFVRYVQDGSGQVIATVADPLVTGHIPLYAVAERTLEELAIKVDALETGVKALEAGDIDPANELQTLSTDGISLTLSNVGGVGGGVVPLPQGPIGPQGPAGLTGATGPTGPQGPSGPAGADGATGPQGPAGPMGLTGATGATGPQGPAGPSGADGGAGLRTVLVSPIGPTDADNGTALIAGVAGISDSSINNPYLINLEPGIYDIGNSVLDLPPYVAIRGAGANLTTIVGRGTSVTSASIGISGGFAIVPGDGSSLESLTLMHIGEANSTPFGAILVPSNVAFSVKHVVIDTSQYVQPSSGNKVGIGLRTQGTGASASLLDVSMIGSSEALLAQSSSRIDAVNVQASDSVNGISASNSIVNLFNVRTTKIQASTASTINGRSVVANSLTTFGSPIGQIILADSNVGGIEVGDADSTNEAQTLSTDGTSLTLSAVAGVGGGIVPLPQGPIGPAGPRGEQGLQGEPGIAGPQGDIGPAGPQGETGPQGGQGVAGVDGLSCWDSSGDGIEDPAEDLNGDGVWNALDCQGSGDITPKVVYRWNTFSTYSQSSGWFANDDPALFGGIPPSRWSGRHARADELSPDKDTLRALFAKRGYGGPNAVIASEEWQSFSSTNSRHAVALFRIKNTTPGVMQWSAMFYGTGDWSFGENVTVAINGALAYDAPCGSGCSPSMRHTAAINIPPSRTSTVIFAVGSSVPGGGSTRSLFLAFNEFSLNLPPGLEYVDDLDTATGGWEQ